MNDCKSLYGEHHNNKFFHHSTLHGLGQSDRRSNLKCDRGDKEEQEAGHGVPDEGGGPVGKGGSAHDPLDQLLLLHSLLDIDRRLIDRIDDCLIGG